MSRPHFIPHIIYLFLIACFAEEAMENSESCAAPPHHKRLTARHIEGKGVEYNNGYTTVEALLKPPMQSWAVLSPSWICASHVFDN